MIAPWLAGLRPGRPAELSLANAAVDVVSQLDRYGIKKAWLVGHQLGAMAALQVAVDEPERVAGLVLTGALVSPGKLALTMQKGLIRMLPNRALAESGATKDDLIRALDVVATADFGKRLGDIAVPVLVIAGASDPGLPSAQAAGPAHPERATGRDPQRGLDPEPRTAGRVQRAADRLPRRASPTHRPRPWPIPHRVCGCRNRSWRSASIPVAWCWPSPPTCSGARSRCTSTTSPRQVRWRSSGTASSGRSCSASAASSCGASGATCVTCIANRRLFWGLAAAGVLVSINWLVYVWGVLNDHIVDASLGYFINPLFTVTLAVLVLRERLRTAQKVALGVGALARSS